MTANEALDPQVILAVPPKETLFQKNKRILITALKTGNASSATISYQGCGDSGDITSVDITTFDGSVFDTCMPVTVLVEHPAYCDGQTHASVTEQELPIEDALQDFVDEALEQHHGGWANNDGGSGKVIFQFSADGAEDSVKLKHTTYFTDSADSETSL